MRKLASVTLVAFLVTATPVYAQVADQRSQPGGSGQMMAMVGTITDIDLVRDTLTLDNWAEFTPPSLFQYTSFPAIGQEVEVIYVEEGGQKVARSVDVWQEGGSS